jgi:hypothetical protein
MWRIRFRVGRIEADSSSVAFVMMTPVSQEMGPPDIPARFIGSLNQALWKVLHAGKVTVRKS